MSFHGEGCTGGFIRGADAPSTPAFSEGIPIIDHSGQLGEWARMKPSTDRPQDDDPVKWAMSDR